MTQYGDGKSGNGEGSIKDVYHLRRKNTRHE